MTKKGKKTLTTILVISISLIVYVTYIYMKSNDDEIVPSFSGVVFALIPALVINVIWNKKRLKE